MSSGSVYLISPVWHSQWIILLFLAVKMHYFIQCYTPVTFWFCHSAFISWNSSIKFCSSTIWLHSLYSKRKRKALFFTFYFPVFRIFGALATIKSDQRVFFHFQLMHFNVLASIHLSHYSVDAQMPIFGL